MDYIDDLLASIVSLEDDHLEEITNIKNAQLVRRRVLTQQVDALKKESYNATEVYKLNAMGHIDEEQGRKEKLEIDMDKCNVTGSANSTSHRETRRDAVEAKGV